MFKLQDLVSERGIVVFMYPRANTGESASTPAGGAACSWSTCEAAGGFEGIS